MATICFNQVKWSSKIYFPRENYTQLCDYVADTAAHEAHLKSKAFTTRSGNELSLQRMSELQKERFIAGRGADLDSAIHMLSRYMVVAAATIIEGMLQEFIEAIFCVSPERMRNYLRASTDDSLVGHVSLKEIIDSKKSYDVLISQLSKRATSVVLSGKFQKQIQRIAELSSLNVNHIALETVELRHRIAHETNEIIIGRETVFRSWEGAAQLLDQITDAAESNGIRAVKFDDLTEDK